MLINNSPTLRTEDFPGEEKLTNRLFSQLNSYFQSVTQVVNGNITFTDNINSITRDYTLLSGFQSISIQWTFAQPPVDLKICKSSKTTQETPCILAAAWSYDSSSKTITVNNIVELTSDGSTSLSGRYKFTLRVTV